MTDTHGHSTTASLKTYVVTPEPVPIPAPHTSTLHVRTGPPICVGSGFSLAVNEGPRPQTTHSGTTTVDIRGPKAVLQSARR